MNSVDEKGLYTLEVFGILSSSNPFPLSENKFVAHLSEEGLTHASIKGYSTHQ